MNMLVVALTTMALVGPPTAKPLALARCPDAAPPLPAQTDQALDATLLVHTASGTGSAFVISPDGFALTAAHVVRGLTRVDIISHAGVKLTAEIVRIAVDQDVALLKLDIAGASSCLQPASGEANLGSDVFIFGSPAGDALSFSVTKGIVSGYRDFEGARFVQLDASVNPGNSGGPALAVSGEVVGIVSWKLSHVALEGLAFGVPIDVALAALHLELADASDADWRERMAVVDESAGRRKPDPDAIDRATPSKDYLAPVRRNNLRTGFIASGIVGISLGAVVIATTFLAYRFQRRLTTSTVTETKWHLTRGFNTFGWASAIAGVALLTTGLVIPKKTKSTRGRRSQRELSWTPSVAPLGLAMEGRF